MGRKLIYHINSRIKKFRSRYIDNFVFIHINKTGGSSIEKTLKLFHEHKTALEKNRRSRKS